MKYRMLNHEVQDVKRSTECQTMKYRVLKTVKDRMLNEVQNVKIFMKDRMLNEVQNVKIFMKYRMLNHAVQNVKP